MIAVRSVTSRARRLLPAGTLLRLVVLVAALLAVVPGDARARPGDVGEPLRVPGFPFVHAHTTVGHTSAITRYSCASTIVEGGPEVVYQLEVPRQGELIAWADGDNVLIDIDVHILAGSRVDRDGTATSCIARGNAIAQLTVQPGTYYVVVDTYDNPNRAGPYRLRLDFQPSDGWYERDLARGVTLRTRRYASFLGNPQFTSVLVVDRSEPEVRVEPLLPPSGCQPLTQFASASNAVAAINAATFDDTTCALQSLLKVEGRVVARNTALTPRTAFGLDGAGLGHVQRINAGDEWPAMTHAVGGLPRLASDGGVDVRTTEEGGTTLLEQSYDSRTLAAVGEPQTLIFATIDGRTAQGSGMNLPQAADWLLGLGLGVREAVNLAGGTNTTLWARGIPYDGIVNYPTRGRGNHLNALPIHSAFAVYGAPLDRDILWLTTPGTGPVAAGSEYVYEAAAADPAGRALVLSAGAADLAGSLRVEDRGDGSARYVFVPRNADAARSPVTLTFVAQPLGGRPTRQTVLLQVTPGVEPDGGPEELDGGTEPDAGLIEVDGGDAGGPLADAGLLAGDGGARVDGGRPQPDAGLVADGGAVGAPASGCSAAGQARSGVASLLLLLLALGVRRTRCPPGAPSATGATAVPSLAAPGQQAELP